MIIIDIFNDFFNKYNIVMEAPDATEYARKQMQSLSNRLPTGNLNAEPNNTKDQPNRQGYSSTPDAVGNIPSFDNPSKSVRDMQNNDNGGNIPTEDNIDENMEDDTSNLEPEMNMEEMDMGEESLSSDDDASSSEEKENSFEEESKERIRVNCISLYDALISNIKSFKAFQPIKTIEYDQSYYIIQKDLEQLKNIIYKFITEKFANANYGTIKRTYNTFMEIYSTIIKMTQEYIKERNKA